MRSASPSLYVRSTTPCPGTACELMRGHRRRARRSGGGGRANSSIAAARSAGAEVAPGHVEKTSSP